jgi:hypothetical protein
MKSFTFLKSHILSYLIRQDRAWFWHFGLDGIIFPHTKLYININGLCIYTSGTTIQLPITLQKKVANTTTHALFDTK